MTVSLQASRMHQLKGFFRQQRAGLTHKTAALAGTVAIAITLWATPGLADPFRPSNPRAVGAQTEEAFRAMFEQGNYRAARELVRTAETDEPLAYAIKAALAYIDGDWNQLARESRQTLQAAERLVQTDPLRGHIYVAVGHFMEGAHILSTQDTVRGAPAALSKLRLVFDSLSQAERIDPQDPELNLIKGYMDLMLAVNLPFSNPDQAIGRLENFAAPTYLAQRGIAIGYRDLDRQDQAMAAVDRALAATPENPDLLYLKAQILVRQDRESDSLRFFEQALEKQNQLPRNLANQMAWEYCRTANRVNNERRNCNRLLDR